MADYKLTYFDIDGGRAEPIRIAFQSAGIAFEDHRISFEDFMSARDGFRFRCVPTLEINGAQVTQSNAMCRYVGKLAGLYPEDGLEALYCDEAVGAVEDLLHAIVATFGLQGEKLKAAREKLVEGWLSIYLKGLDEMLARGGDYFADNRLTIADLKVFPVTRWLMSGELDHVPTDIVARLAPKLVEHEKLVTSDPVVVAYYRSRQQ